MYPERTLLLLARRKRFELLQLLESLPECGEECLIFVVVFGRCHQQADPPYVVSRLRARRERPCRCAAEQQRDERASSLDHLIGAGE